ncbi:MAG: LuxR C-terminal-related transcriptional regulator [Desulfococcaceae bacterium]
MNLNSYRRTSDVFLLHCKLNPWKGAAILINPAEHIILSCSRGAEALFGYALEELVGARADILHGDPARFHEFRQWYLLAMEKDIGVEAECAMRCKDGTTFPAIHSLTRLSDGNGSLLGVLQVVDVAVEEAVAQKALRDARKLFREQFAEMERRQLALEALLGSLEKDKAEAENRVLCNIRDSVCPYIERLKKSRLTPDQLETLRLIEARIRLPFGVSAVCMDRVLTPLTPSEIKIAGLIREGKTAKEIGQFLNLSENTVNFHRQNLRVKLGLKKQKISLRSFLLSMKK